MLLRGRIYYADGGDFITIEGRLYYAQGETFSWGRLYHVTPAIGKQCRSTKSNQSVLVSTSPKLGNNSLAGMPLSKATVD